MVTFPEHFRFMDLALDQARSATKLQEVPVGCVVVSSDGKILAQQFNRKETDHNPCAHAEILALIEATNTLNNWRLIDTRVYVTLEPCPMCLSAMIQARIGACIFGAYDSKGGALSLGYSLFKDKRLNHNFSIMGGISQEECANLLSHFFKERRSYYKT